MATIGLFNESGRSREYLRESDRSRPCAFRKGPSSLAQDHPLFYGQSIFS